METTLLLSKADFADYADLPESLELDRLRPHILAAQRQRLRPILTGPLLTELLLLVGDERVAAGPAQPRDGRLAGPARAGGERSGLRVARSVHAVCPEHSRFQWLCGENQQLQPAQ